MECYEVWVITSGQYAEFRIHQLCTTKELAEAYVANWSSKPADIEIEAYAVLSNVEQVHAVLRAIGEHS